MISVPYAGLVPTAGKTPAEVEQEIVARIKNRAIEPQAVVALVTQNSSLITVIGEINSTITSPTGRIPAQPSGERILDVITRAGGMRDQGQDVWVVLDRHGQRASVPFGSLIYEPGNNIWAWPGDTIYLYQEPQTFLAFGATGAARPIQILCRKQLAGILSSAWRMTLAEGLAAAGGLSTCKPIQVPCSFTAASHENLLRSSASIAQKWTVQPCRSSIQLALLIQPVISWPRRYKCTIRTCCLPLMPSPLV